MKHILALLFVVSFVQASHFRYGSASYRIPDPIGSPRTVEFTVVLGWRYDLVNALSWNYGDGSSGGFAPNTNTFLGIFTDATGLKYQMDQYVFSHTYSSFGTFTARYSSCCRISTLKNGNDQNFDVSIIVKLDGSGNPSPRATTSAVINMAQGQTNVFALPVVSSPGSTTTCSFAPFSVQFPVTFSGSALSLSPNCVLTWNVPSTITIGWLYAVSVVLRDSATGATGYTDFIIQITRPTQFSCNLANPADSLNHVIAPGASVSLAFAVGDPLNPGVSITSQNTALPSGATVSNVGSTSPMTTNFNFVSTQANAGGVYSIVLLWTLGSLTQCTKTINIEVLSTPPPTISCPADMELVLDTSLQGYIPDLVSLATVNDFGVSSTTTQSNPAGSLVSGAQSFLITLTTSNNIGSDSCTTTVTFVPPPPEITCEEKVVVTLDEDCHAEIPDLASSADVTTYGVPSSVSQDKTGFLDGEQDIVVNITVSNSYGSDWCTTLVVLEDNTPPSINPVLSTNNLWPPNHKMTTVTVNFNSHDNCQDVTCVISDAVSNEDDNSNADGNTSGDAVISSDGQSVSLRAERRGSGSGRIYTLTSTCTDKSGNTVSGTSHVSVAQSQGKGK